MQLVREIAATVDIVVQLSVIDGRHVITGIEEINGTVSHQTQQSQSNQIFVYDRARNVHIAANRPSDEFITRIANRGITMNAQWFRGHSR